MISWGAEKKCRGQPRGVGVKTRFAKKGRNRLKIGKASRPRLIESREVQKSKSEKPLLGQGKSTGEVWSQGGMRSSMDEKAEEGKEAQKELLESRTSENES